MPTRTGGLNTKNYSDPAYLKQAASIGARVDPKTGKWYDEKDGHFIDQNEANKRTQQAGTAATYNYDRGGLSGVYDRNDHIIDPALSLAATALPGVGAIAGPLVAAGLNYGKTHDLGKAALTGAATYGGSQLLGAAGKIPGVGKIGDAIKDSSIGQTVSNIGDKIGASGVGQLWDKSVADPIQQVTQGIKLPDLGAITGGKSGGGIDLMGLLGVGNAAYLGDKANNYAKLAGENADRAYKEKAPIREMGIAGMQAAPKTLPELGAIRGRNPFAGA